MKNVLLIYILYVINIYSQQINWLHTNGPMGGMIGDIAINSLGEIYSGTYSYMDFYYRGLFKSNNNGDNWIKVENQFDDFEVYSIYITKEDHIWVGTNYQGRIYRSTDNGSTWENKRNGYNTGECWAFGESKTGVLVAGDGQYCKIFRSTDYGENWSLSTNLCPLVFATDSNNIIYCGTKPYGLFASSDNGITWAQNNFLKNNPVSSILIDSNNNIYCGTGYYDNGNGVYYSSDAGQTWIHLGLEGKIVLSLAFDSYGNLFAGTKEDGLFKTTNMGQSWEQFREGLFHRDVFRLKINKQNNIFIGAEKEGVYRSQNGGKQFEQIGLPVSNLKNVCFWNDSLIYASTPSGVQRYNKISKEWKNLGLNNVFAISISPNGILYTATFADGLFKSIDFGETWIKTNLTLDSIMSCYNVFSLSDDSVLVATEFNLRMTTNGGNTWSILPINTSFFSRGMFFSYPNFWVTGNHNLFNTNNFNNFDTSFSGLDWSENNCIYGLLNGTIYLTDKTAGTYRSINNGDSWHQILPSMKSVWSIYAEDNGLVIGGAKDTLWYSSNFGETWDTFLTPLYKKSNVTEIKKDDAGQLYIGTFSEGLFELDIITNINEENSKNLDYYLYQNYPNPFNPTTTIKFTIAKEGLTSLIVYDVLGREVKNIFNENKLPGKYTLELNASDLPSGVYFYKLKGDGYSDTKKMILLK